MRKQIIFAVAGIAIMVLAGYAIWQNSRDSSLGGNQAVVTGPLAEGAPRLKIETVVEGLSNIWDVEQAPDSTLFYTERDNKVGAVINGQPVTIHETNDAAVGGEGGMLGMELDPDFEQNRYLYACFNTKNDIRLARFVVAADNWSLNDRKDIITGLPVNPSGRHSGCRPQFGPDNYLWVTTGDTARSEHSQSPSSLGGKILRVNREGQAAPNNLEPPFDPRIYSYGHRNVQGIAFYPSPRQRVIGYSSEHGPDRDDEINTLEKGNFGWAPGPGYDESAAMTDLQKFPEAISAVWSSGDPTIAISGATILDGSAWKSWQGRLAVAVQKDEHVRLLGFDSSGKKLTSEDVILDNFGRIRTAVMGNNDELYITTDNGRNDKIIRIVPQ